MADLDIVLNRIRMDYLEMPDLKLTFWQARRLWNLDEAMCETALDVLVSNRFLWRSRDGAYLRRREHQASA